MSCGKVGLQRRLRHFSPCSRYLNCRNHRLAVCLVYLVKQFPELFNLDKFLISTWKLSKYSSIKISIFLESQETMNFKSLHNKVAHTWGIMYLYYIQIWSINSNAKWDLHQRDPETKGVRDLLLTPKNILMILLLAEDLSPVNRICQFLQTRNLNFCSIDNRIDERFKKLKIIKEKFLFTMR